MPYLLMNKSIIATVPLVPIVIGGFREWQPLARRSRYVLPTRRASRVKGADAPFEQRSLNARLHKLGELLAYSRA